MTMTDPIADMLTRIRNANTASYDLVELPSSKEKLAIARILADQGYIESYEVVPARVGQTIKIVLKSGPDKGRRINGLKRVSKPGLRVYAKADGLPKVLGGMGTAIISTSSGLMTDREAGKRKIGGEVVAFVW